MICVIVPKMLEHIDDEGVEGGGNLLQKQQDEQLKWIRNCEIKEINIKDTTFPAFSTVIRGFLRIYEDYDRWTNKDHSFTEYTLTISRMILMKNYFSKYFLGR
jgi:hypothetical protein